MHNQNPNPNCKPNGNDSKRRNWIAGIVIAGTAAIGFPAIASAGTAPSEPAPGSGVPDSVQQRLDVLCERIPNLQTRTNNLIVRLQSDAETRGSLAWLTEQVTRARDNGREEHAVVLEQRLAVRTATLDVLKLRVDSLAEIAMLCDGRAE